MGTDITRKLATVQKIISLDPIEGADRIELAKVLGWQVVVKKGEFSVGENVIYVEIDSFVPNTVAPFLTREGSQPHEYEGVKGQKLKTIRLKKQLSQGLILPLGSVITDAPERQIEGFDLTELLNIKKWEPTIAANLMGKVRGNFPTWIPKTDQERIQNLWNKVPRNATWEVSIKMDGSSCTVYRKDYFGVCSRNMDLIETPDNSFWKAIRDQDIEKKIDQFNNIALQGELIGMGIQGNNEKLDHIEFRVFDIFDIEKQMYLSPTDRRALCKECGLLHVPVIEERFDFAKFATIEEALLFADGPSMNPNVKREGLVFKVNELTGDEITSFKIISNKYLLKQE